jgi:hypothetical protein
MGRSRSVIFWLLLAATICIDVAAFSGARSSSTAAYVGGDFLGAVICDALLASQLSVVCVWAALGTNRLLWVPVVAALLAGVVTAVLFDSPSETFASSFHMYLSVYGLEAATLLAGLWIIRGTHYWRQRTDRSAWQFSVANLLLVMTAAAVLATTLRTGPFTDEEKWTNLGFALSVIGMSLASTIWWSLSWHWLLRFAATLGTALALGCLFSYFTAELGASGAYAIGSHYLVQAIVLSAWLGWGPILPLRTESLEGET